MTELNTIIKTEKMGPFFHNGTSGAAKNVSLSQFKYRTVRLRCLDEKRFSGKIANEPSENIPGKGMYDILWDG